MQQDPSSSDDDELLQGLQGPAPPGGADADADRLQSSYHASAAALELMDTDAPEPEAADPRLWAPQARARTR